jgi:hypothetical protein
MRVGLIAALLSLTAVTGCTNNAPQKAVESWIGQPDGALFGKFGPPADTQTLPDGRSSVLSFDAPVQKRGPGYEMPMPGIPGASYHVDGPSVMGTCRLTFTVIDHVVIKAVAAPDCAG